jgi:hypothetical protein
VFTDAAAQCWGHVVCFEVDELASEAPFESAISLVRSLAGAVRSGSVAARKEMKAFVSGITSSSVRRERISASSGAPALNEQTVTLLIEALAVAA